MDKQEALIIKRHCRGNRKSLLSIGPLGLDFDIPIGRFLGVLRVMLVPYGFIYSEHDSDENRKVFVNENNNSAVIVLIVDNEVKEVYRFIAYANLHEQLTAFEDLINEVVEAHGAPHDWDIIDNDVTACSWDAQNLNCLSIGFNRNSNETIFKYMRNQFV